MDTVKQVYLLDEKGNKYSPIVSPQSVYVNDDITLNNHINSPNKLVLYTDFNNPSNITFDNSVPVQNVIVQSTSHFTLTGTHAICQQSGLYKIDAYVRVKDKVNVTDVQDINQNADVSIQIKIDNSISYNIWRNTTYRSSLDIMAVADIQKGQTLGMSVYMCDPAHTGAILVPCSYAAIRVFTM